MKAYNLYLLILWTVVGVALVVRNAFISEAYRTDEWKTRLDIMMYGAFVLAVWNLLRFLSSRQTSREREQWREYQKSMREPEAKNPPVVNPEFDFGQPKTPTEAPRDGKI